jgi:DNA-binding response OmpR family regulator
MMRAHPETMAWSPGPRPLQPVPTEARPVLLAAVAAADVEKCSVPSFQRFVPQSTTEALRIIERERPGVVIVDFDLATFDGPQITHAAATLPATSVLVTTAAADRAPAALKAGCHAVLLKPFAPNLVAARLGRLVRERAQQMRMRGFTGSGKPLTECGTNRVWPATTCPRCNTAGATSFEFSSHRRMWYACLACDQVWLGARQE